jgi:hypothetical protein
MDKELQVVLKENGIEQAESDQLLEGFKAFLERVKILKDKAVAIVVKDASEVDKMKEARLVRLELKDIRVKAENVRKERKEFFLRGGRAVDAVANIVKAAVVPLEEHLDKQEKFVERLEEERKDKVNNERIAALTPYVTDITMFNLRDMTEGAFDILLKGSRTAWEDQDRANKKDAADRKAKEEADKLENERIRKENEKLKADKEEAERRERTEREAREKAEKDLKDKEAAAAREAKDKLDGEKKAQADKKRLEKQKKYRTFREGFGWTDATKLDFKEENVGTKVVLWKKLGEFDLE